MDFSAINYELNSASEKAILTHLLICKDDFIPSLDKTVNLAEYAKKIAQNAITFEAWAGSELVGLIAAYFNDDKEYTGFITNVSILKPFTHKGIAANLMQNCIQYALSKKFGEIVLEVQEINKQAINLYQKFHFVDMDTKGSLKKMRLNLKN